MKMKSFLIASIIIIITVFLLNLIAFFLVSFTLENNDSIKNYRPIFRRNFSVDNLLLNGSIKQNGIEYNSPSIIIFGGGFASCYGVDEKETFSAQLSEYMKSPVYNRSVGGGGIQHAIIQVSSGKINDIIKRSNKAIYVFSCPQDTDRLYGYPGPIIQSGFLLDEYMYPILKRDKNNKFFIQNTAIPFIKGSILYRIIAKIYTDIKYKMVYKSNQAKDMNIYFAELNRALKEINPDIQLYILLYFEEESYFSKFIENYDYKDIKFLYVTSLTDIDVMKANPPKGKEWKIIVPALADKLK